MFDMCDFTFFEKLPILYKGTDTSKITEFLNSEIARGQEGIMINICDAPYEFKRTTNLLKVKKMQTLDLQIIGFEEGTGRLAGTLGAILVKYKDGNVVKVGSGFTDWLRTEIWNNQSKYLNAICEISYFEETTNADGGISLRFPIFKDFRTDKLEADF
jgi:DNA ligase-1